MHLGDCPAGHRKRPRWPASRRLRVIDDYAHDDVSIIGRAVLSLPCGDSLIARLAFVLKDTDPPFRAFGLMAFQVRDAIAQPHCGTLPLSVNWFQKMSPSLAPIGRWSRS